MAKDFNLDLSRTYKNGMPNNNMLFELFGEFSREPGDKVRRCMINSVKNDVEEFKTCCKTALQLKGISGECWIQNMENPYTAGDKLCLFLLGRIYFRHSTVLTKYSIWSTIDTTLRVSDQHLIFWSSIKLVYMGSNAYGILRPKNTAITPPGIPLSVPSGNAIYNSNVAPVRGRLNRRGVGRTLNVTPNSRGNRFNTPLQRHSSRVMPPQYQTRRRNTPLYPLPYALPTSSRLMETRSRRPSNITPSQCVELNRSSPARPLNKVTTIPGYSFSYKTWNIL